MPDDTDYQGFTNQETWAVNLYLSNEPSLQRSLHFISNDATLYDKGDIMHGRALSLESYVQGLLDVASHNIADPSLMRAMQIALIDASMNRVNWREIIEHNLDQEQV